jgi:hypothetical protein
MILQLDMLQEENDALLEKVCLLTRTKSVHICFII